MTEFKMITKNVTDVDKKPRVYFTCHPDDLSRYLKGITDEILFTHDCAIYYTENMAEEMADEEREDLTRFNLFVVPVTFKALTAPNRAIDKDIPYAISKNIPVLPIVMESGIDQWYYSRLKELQYLTPVNTDGSAISYREKLKKYLDSVLIGDEMAKRIRDAFDAYIFLSYRKKDRKYANELMRLIHSNPECRDIAIWFDEFLTPGESFKKNIEKMLDDSKLFTLLVTPRILEKDNYVVSTELPLAIEKGRDILAVEMEKTDEKALSEINVMDAVNFKDEAFRTRLLNAISRIAVTKNDSPEHTFLMGLAYLEGIDVEVDREKGVSLIGEAAENGLVEAIDKLYVMYSEGIGIKVDYVRAAELARKKYEMCLNSVGEEHTDTILALNNLAVALNNCGEHRTSLELQEKAYALYLKTLGEDHEETLMCLSNLAASYGECAYNEKALKLSEKAYLSYCSAFGNTHPHTVNALSNFAYQLFESGDIGKAAELMGEAYEIRKNILGEEHPDTLISLNNLAHILNEKGDEKAIETAERAYVLRRKVLGDEHPYTLGSLNNLALCYCGTDDVKAKEIMMNVYEHSVAVFGKKHPNTVRALDNLATVYRAVNENAEALRLQQQAYEYYSEIFGEGAPDTLIALNNLSVTLSEMGEKERALEMTERSYNLHTEIFGENDLNTLCALNNYAMIVSQWEKGNKAISLNERLYKKNVKLLGKGHPDTVDSLNNLAVSFGKNGNHRKALKLTKQAYKMGIRVFGKAHPQTLNYLENLMIIYKNLGRYRTAQIIEVILNSYK